MIFDPSSKADELAAICLQADPNSYYERFTFDNTRFPDLLPGEIIQVIYKRIRPPMRVLTWTDAHVVEATA